MQKINVDMQAIRSIAKKLRAHLPRKRGVVMRLSASSVRAGEASFLGYQTWDGSRRSFDDAALALAGRAPGDVVIRFDLHATHPAIAAQDNTAIENVTTHIRHEAQPL